MALPLQAKTDALGRYYTCSEISTLLVSEMSPLRPCSVLDLGCGSGALSRAAAAHWAEAEFITVDLDAGIDFSGKCGKDKISFRHRHIQMDALSSALPSALNGEIQAAVCNPPFIAPKWRSGFSEILEAAGFSGCLPNLSTADSALLFLAQNLRLLVDGGSLGIILPDSLVSASRYRAFRKILLQKYSIARSIRLPRRSFANTDALGHILILEKSPPVNDFLELCEFDSVRGIIGRKNVTLDHAIHRMDYSYHAGNFLVSADHCFLNEITESLCRGSLSSGARKNHPGPIFHTTDMVGEYLYDWADLIQFGLEDEGFSAHRKRYTYAQPGDILLARVGRNLEIKIVGVGAGLPILTDCVFRLRVVPKYRELVLNQLSSVRGRDWIASRAYGVSAKQISKTDILQFPVYLKCDRS